MIHAALVVVALAVSAPPGAQKPEYSQALSPAWGRGAKCAADDTAYSVHITGAATASTACFGWGSLVHLEAQGGAFTVCQADTSTLTFTGIPASGQETELVDANGDDGVGACTILSSGKSTDIVIKSSVTKHAIGSRQSVGICTAPVKQPGGDVAYPSCRVSGDCLEAGAVAGTTCDTSLSSADIVRMEQNGCAQLIFQCDTDSAVLGVRVDR